MDRTPCSIAFFAASSAAIWAAKGVLFLDPLKPWVPALDQAVSYTHLTLPTTPYV